MKLAASQMFGWQPNAVIVWSYSSKCIACRFSFLRFCFFFLVRNGKRLKYIFLCRAFVITFHFSLTHTYTLSFSLSLCISTFLLNLICGFCALQQYGSESICTNIILGNVVRVNSELAIKFRRRSNNCAKIFQCTWFTCWSKVQNHKH